MISIDHGSSKLGTVCTRSLRETAKKAGPLRKKSFFKAQNKIRRKCCLLTESQFKKLSRHLAHTERAVNAGSFSKMISF